jgi:ribonuclease Z
VNFDVTILGCGAATPTRRHRPTAQLVSIRDHYFLLDCGEGTQMQMRELGIKMQRIGHILISHLHGDHIYGLLGLLSTYALLGRTQPLVLIGPPDLKKWIDDSFKMSASYLTYPLQFIATNGELMELIWENDWLEIHAIPLKHRLHCNGFLFKEKPHERKVIKSMISERKILLEEIVQLKRNQNVNRANGEVLHADEVCYPSMKQRRYFFSSDTIPIYHECKDLEEVDLIYHEATFLNDKIDRAKSTFHSTAAQAAQVAQHLSAKRLILGHFSARYPELHSFIEEAKPHFEHVEIAEEGKTWEIPL